jgi:glutaminase
MVKTTPRGCGRRGLLGGGRLRVGLPAKSGVSGGVIA